jgi:hypothetical protein
METWEDNQVDNFMSYLNKHRHRIVNYSYLQAEGISTGSGTIESTVKQIAARIKLSGAQWETENIPQVLLQAEGISIGSGAIESTVKQIGQRMKLAGAQWEKGNVPHVLMQRTAYLNGQFSK